MSESIKLSVGNTIHVGDAVFCVVRISNGTIFAEGQKGSIAISR